MHSICFYVRDKTPVDRLTALQILLRRLLDENPCTHEIRDINESLYEKLIGMFEKWKVSIVTSKIK